MQHFAYFQTLDISTIEQSDLSHHFYSGQTESHNQNIMEVVQVQPPTNIVQPQCRIENTGGPVKNNVYPGSNWEHVQQSDNTSKSISTGRISTLT